MVRARGYINSCISSLYNPLVRGRELYLPKYPNTIANTHYALRACRWGRYRDPNLPTLLLRNDLFPPPPQYSVCGLRRFRPPAEVPAEFRLGGRY